MKLALRVTTLWAFSLLICAASATPSADEILNTAEQQAASQHKTIFLHFSASWCIWCKRLDAFLDRPEIKPVFEKYFLPVKLDVEEHDGKKDLENPGGADYEKKFGGPAGLPYLVFLSADGSSLANSKLNGSNIGYPGEPAEIAYFMQMIKTAAPQISATDAALIESSLKAAAPSSAH